MVDWWVPLLKGTILVSLYGFNSGVQQYLQLFDSFLGPTTTFDSADSATEIVTCSNAPGLTLGEAIQTSGLVGVSDGAVSYVRPITPSTFTLYDTRAHAMALGATTGRRNITANDGGTITFLPVHTMVIGATDNYSMIIPVTGFPLTRGLTLALSSTAGVYTASGSTDASMFGTYVL